MEINFNNILRKIVPRKFQTLIRFYQIFNDSYGHSNVVNGMITSGDNMPLPWITYPAIEFLDTLDLSGCTVFEYGSGSSTHFWASRAKNVTSVEKDSLWFEKVKNSLPKNCTIYLKNKDLEYVNVISDSKEKFDIIIVDGAVRYPCTETAINHLSDSGMIILDNSDWYPKCCELLQQNGFTQIDFSGFSPLNAFTASTSVFFKDAKLLRKKLKPILPMGRRDIGVAYDDKQFEEIDKQFLNF